MHKTRNTLLIIAAVIIIGCLLYVPCMTKLGLYRDDWNNYYNAMIYGPDTLIEHYGSDRPADGYLLSVMFRLFGTNNNAYLIYNLCCRILGSIFFSLTLLVIWPKTSKMAGIAGILAVIFPGFLQQIDGIAYVPHQTAMFLFMLSLLLTAKACEPGQKTWNVLFTFLSMIFSFGCMILMEYYIGMEIYRFALIYLMNREQAGNGKPKAFFKSLLSYLPYLIPAAGFVAWRTFVFSAQRNGTDVISEVVRPFIEHPRHEILVLGMRFLKNIWKLFAGVWTIPAFNMINGMEMKPFVYALIPSLIITAAALVFLLLMHRRKSDEAVLDARNESAQWLWCGLITGTIAVFPLVLAGRDINFSSSLDRFAWPGMIGTILFLTGLLGSIKDRSLRNILTMAAVLLAVFVQWQNKINYIDIWQNTKDYWQQLMWRAPGLKEGTTIVSGGAILTEEDYEVFIPASLIYYPNKNNHSPLGAEILRENTVRSVKLGDKVGRTVREIYIEKDYKKLLAISKPNSAACLRVIDGDAPIYSLNEWSKIPEIGAWSKVSQIDTAPESSAVIPFFLGAEQDHGWCYYYEKMELSLQMNDPQKAAELADEAAANNLKAGDDVEWIPVIEAYTESGRTEDALSAAERLRKDEYMAYNAVNYFSMKDNAEEYADVVAFLSGKTVNLETAAEEESLPAAEETSADKETLKEEETPVAEEIPAVEETPSGEETLPADEETPADGETPVTDNEEGTESVTVSEPAAEAEITVIEDETVDPEKTDPVSDDPSAGLDGYPENGLDTEKESPESVAIYVNDRSGSETEPGAEEIENGE